SISTLTQTVGKVASLHVQSAQGEYLLILLRAETPIFNTPKDDIILLAASLHTAEVSCFFVDEPALHRRGSTSETVKTVRLQLPSNFVVTSMYFARGPRRIFMGSRKGAVAIYDLSSAVATPESIAIEAMTCFRRIHGEDAVSAIVGIPNSQQAALANSQIVTVGRNGTYAVHQVHWDDPSASTTRLNTVHVSSPSIKLMITGSFYDVANNLIFYGFHNTDFIVWDETSQKVLMNVSCGGAHRSWDYYAIHGEYGKGAFVWTQAALMHLRVQDGNAFTTLQSGGHGREIKAVAISPRLSDHSGNTRIVATGAEDTDIRLFSVERHGDGGSQQSGTKCLRILKKHTTGIQHLQWSNSGDFLFSSGGFEEFYVWRVTFVPGFGIGTLLEASCPVRSESPDLRIMSFDVLALSKGDTPKSGLPSEGFLISMVLSDSNIRVYQYSPENKTFETLFRGTYGSCCLTEASHFRIDNSLHSCVGGTDGHLAIYEYEKAGMAPKDYLQSITSTIDRPRNLPLLQRFAVHQSTVKCLTIASLASGEALVVSGGDDSAIAFTRLKFNGPDTQLSHSTLLVPRAHASAVTALTQLPVFNFFGREGENESYSVFLFATSSNDQRLKIWSLRINLTKPGVSEFQPLLALDISTSIADCSSLATFRESQNAATVKVIVCGVGMDVWEIDCGHLVP
ncbi:MAG: hypothetical protein M1833_005684, partial [Piccolia ochrophora]